MGATDTAGERAVVVDGLVKHYGDVEALGGVSFAVPEGTVLGLLGPTRLVGAQSTTGAIRGHVTDIQGLAVPGVTVTVMWA